MLKFAALAVFGALQSGRRMGLLRRTEGGRSYRRGHLSLLAQSVRPRAVAHGAIVSMRIDGAFITEERGAAAQYGFL
jgi:hypothetical protein